MYAVSPEGWKDVEITGYVRLQSYSFDEEFAWAARSGKHSPSEMCDSTAYFGAVGFSGKVWFQKKLFHGEGYTDRRTADHSIAPIQDRWIGIKLVTYNLEENGKVKLELWIDNHADNNWTLIAETIDEGGWKNDMASFTCGIADDYVITKGYPRAMFRVDNASFEFKNFSVREIDPTTKLA
jgi:hypothetical protein